MGYWAIDIGEQSNMQITIQKENGTIYTTNITALAKVIYRFDKRKERGLIHSSTTLVDFINSTYDAIEELMGDE